jgi:hypothetical protein
MSSGCNGGGEGKRRLHVWTPATLCHAKLRRATASGGHFDGHTQLFCGRGACGVQGLAGSQTAPQTVSSNLLRLHQQNRVLREREKETERSSSNPFPLRIQRRSLAPAAGRRNCIFASAAGARAPCRRCSSHRTARGRSELEQQLAEEGARAGARMVDAGGWGWWSYVLDDPTRLTSSRCQQGPTAWLRR